MKSKFHIFVTLIGLAVFLAASFYFLEKVGMVKASTNIHSTSTDHWGWNDIAGWQDFYVGIGGSNSNVLVRSWEVLGTVSSSLGEVVLNCESDPNGCSGPAGDWGVINDFGGNLSGWAWNDVVGWTNFCGTTVVSQATGSCPLMETTYRVTVANPSSSSDEPPSDFFGWAWNDVVGWTSFNCHDLFLLNPGAPGACDINSSTSYGAGYKVRTDWSATSTYGDLYSAVFDTGSAFPVDYNSIAWVGTKPAGTEVWFQFAVRNDCNEGLPTCADDTWTFVGPGGSTSDFYTTNLYGNSGVFYTNIGREFRDAGRYFRYRIRLKSDSTRVYTPGVYKVNVNWGY